MLISRTSILALSIAITGCSTTATISRINRPEIDAEFAGSDRENVYVKTNRGVHAISRAEVTDIDHPGDTATVVGLLIGGYGAANIAIGAPKCEQYGSAFCAGVFTPAVVGLGMTIWGLVVHSQSEEALRTPYDGPSDSDETRDRDSALRLMPTVLTTPEQRVPGAVLTGRF